MTKRRQDNIESLSGQLRSSNFDTQGRLSLLILDRVTEKEFYEVLGNGMVEYVDTLYWVFDFRFMTTTALTGGYIKSSTKLYRGSHDGW